MNFFNRIIKFIFDRVVAFVGLLMLGIPLIVVAIMVKVTMPDEPVFYKQVRVGRHGKLFKIHKFRTMTNEKELSNIAYPNRARITPLGAKLRHHKIDELPELWDVLIGKMSFVGPGETDRGLRETGQGQWRSTFRRRDCPVVQRRSDLSRQGQDQLRVLP
jgi:lipopolysaccharide/colanic/teichoic acid biosynthesis glycosyltransferase